MSFLNKTYIFEKNEKYKEFLESTGLPDDQIEVILNFKPTEILKKEGDEYILSVTTSGEGNFDVKFKDGVEFDEEVSPGIVGKSKFSVGDNVINQSQSFGDLTLFFKREYSGDKLVMDITSNKWDGVAHRYFKAA